MLHIDILTVFILCEKKIKIKMIGTLSGVCIVWTAYTRNSVKYSNIPAVQELREARELHK